LKSYLRRKATYSVTGQMVEIPLTHCPNELGFSAFG
jgi:hypothetical protein